MQMFKDTDFLSGYKINENKTKIIIWHVIPDEEYFVRKQTIYETPEKLKEISSTPLDRMHYNYISK